VALSDIPRGSSDISRAFQHPYAKAKDSYTTGQEDQKITLTKADFVGGSTSDQQIIQELVTKDMLIIDS
jgi:hypothetical protein